MAHGGIPPTDVPGYPASALNPVLPNRMPFCEDSGANGPCGTTSSCLRNEMPQALPAGQNEYEQGQMLDIPWLLAVVHGSGNLIDVWLRHVDSGREDLLVSGFPQGDNGSQGDVIVIDGLQIPVDFPMGPAVIEAGDDTGGDIYYDCQDLVVVQDAGFIFGDGMESSATRVRDDGRSDL